MSPEELARTSTITRAYYDATAEAFWRGTRDHDVSQNVDALLRYLEVPAPALILDVGCGPGRDLMTFRDRGHVPVGLDGAPAFVRMAREHAGSEVLEQDLLCLDLPSHHFDGVFANAALFHVPGELLPRVLSELRATLKPGGVFFASNPRGPDVQEWHGQRYGCYWSWPTWRALVIAAGFTALEHYYRPAGRPRAQQPWLASVWRSPRCSNEATKC